ncbi:MAG TPA: imelysin family protein [Kofleriaceae bacterium]|nr:imelysin family protein [Kofleriaceae bacterium]
MAGSWPRSLALAAALAAAACGGDDGGDGGGGSQADARPDDDFDRQAMMAHLASEVILPTYQAFAERAGELEGAVAGWCEALGGGGEADALEAARDAWRAAMVEWQKAEMMLVGPAAMSEGAVRDSVYSWPLVSSCAVDQDIRTRMDDPAGYDIGSRDVRRRGLAALEYVLFTASLDHTCPEQVAPAGWNDLGDAERLAARCGFASAAAADVAATAGSIVQGWAADGGGYVTELSAGQGSSLSPMEAANLVSDAMFRLDGDTKDMRIGEPAGIMDSLTCPPGDPCPAELESPHARHGKENVVGNLVGFRMLFTGDVEGGASGPGFDDFLRAVGGGELADEMTADLEAAIAATEAIPGALEDAIHDSPNEVAAAYDAVKQVTDDLKSQFLTVLGLDPPDGQPTDND